MKIKTLKRIGNRIFTPLVYVIWGLIICPVFLLNGSDYYEFQKEVTFNIAITSLIVYGLFANWSIKKIKHELKADMHSRNLAEYDKILSQKMIDDNIREKEQGIQYFEIGNENIHLALSVATILLAIYSVIGFFIFQ